MIHNWRLRFNKTYNRTIVGKHYFIKKDCTMKTIWVSNSVKKFTCSVCGNWKCKTIIGIFKR